MIGSRIRRAIVSSPPHFPLPTTADRIAASGEPAEPLRRVEGNNYAPDNPNSDRVNATLMALVRNQELDQMLMSMRDLERTWNHKFNYPWTFFNDEPFSDEFKRKTTAATNAKVYYGTSTTGVRWSLWPWNADEGLQSSFPRNIGTCRRGSTWTYSTSPSSC